MPGNYKNNLRYAEDPESAFDLEGLNNEIDSNNSSNNSSRGFSWANFAMGIPSSINTAKENLSATQEFSGSVWDNDNNKSRNGWQIADALLGFGNNMFYAANPWANPEVQGKIAEEKNKFDTFSDSLENINYANTSSLLEAQKDFNNLELGMTLEDFGGNRDAGDRAKSVFASAASGAASGSIGGPWGMLGGAISGLVGGLIGVANEDTETAKKMYKEFQRKQRYLNNRATASFDLQKNNIMNNDIRNLRGGMVAAFGGDLSTQGGDWSDGLTFVNAGGSHSENPYGGVPVGIAPDQRPNLVEEGEIIWNDYVFSNRIKVPKTLSEKYRLKEDVTFAKAVEKIQKSAEERPNDKIEQDTLNNILSEFMTEQEIIRQKKAEKQAAKELQGLAEMFADGGGLSRSKDYGSKKKPYPKVKSGDFAGGGRSYPIPTKADAIDALRLAGLHHRPDVKAKVYKKYPELKKAFGGHLHALGDWLNAENLRYMPVIGSILGAGFALADNPDYQYAEALEDAARNYTNAIPKVDYKGLSDKLAYNPMDMAFPVAQQQAANAATRSAIRTNVGNNRGAILNSLLAANYADNLGLGTLYRQGLEYNDAQRRAVADFNRGTNQFKAQAYNAAAAQNARLAAMKAEMLMNTKANALAMRNQEDKLVQASRAQALTNMFDNLGGVGKESWIFKMIEDNPALMYAYLNGASGSMGYKGK